MQIRASAKAVVGALGAVLVLLLWSLQYAAKSDEMPMPTGPVILTITGAISRTNAPDRTEFDEAMLEALGTERITTSSRWVDGKPTFGGVPIRKLLEAVGAHGSSVTARALDDYTVDIPIADFTRYPVLLALRMNGKALSPREKGPLWIVYPRADYPELLDAAVDA